MGRFTPQERKGVKSVTNYFCEGPREDHGCVQNIGLGGIELFCDSPDEEKTARDLDDGGGEGASDPAKQDMQDFEYGGCLNIGNNRP